MALMLHAGAEKVEYDQLRALRVPEATATHVPIPHHRLVEIVRHALTFYGHEVTEEHHGITKDGQRYFGLMSLRSAYGDYTDTVGIRNSHDKSFPVGLAWGHRVFVCDNLAFSGSTVLIRRHTVRALRDIHGMLAEIVEPLALQREAQHKQLTTYKGTVLTPVSLNHAVMECYRQEVYNLHRIPEVLNQFENPSHDWGDKTAWRLMNAVTYSLAGKVAENPTITQRLHGVLDSICNN